MSDRSTRLTARGALFAAALGTAIAAAGPARAGSLGPEALVSSSALLIGAQPSSVGYSFNVSGPGTLQVTLSDDQWPNSLSDLNFQAVDGNQLAFALNGPGTTTYDISGAGSYFGYVTGLTGGSLDLGLYSLKISFDPAQPVPLPASMWMLLGGLAAAAGVLRYRATLPSARRARAPQPVASAAEEHEAADLPLLAH